MRSRTVVLVGAASLLLSMAGCGGGPGVDPRVAASQASLASQSAAAESGRLARDAAAASSEAAVSEAAASSAAEAAASSSAEAAKPKPPHVYKGRGDSVIKITKPDPEQPIVAVMVTGNASSGYFGVKGVDGDQDTLVNTTDPYNGTTLMDANGGDTTELQVTATGSWSISLSDLKTVPSFSDGPAYTGKGDAILVYRGAAGIATITGNRGGQYFGVKYYDSTTSDSLVNTTDPYTGSVPWPAGVAIVVVTATGGWSITVAQ